MLLSALGLEWMITRLEQGSRCVAREEGELTRPKPPE